MRILMLNSEKNNYKTNALRISAIAISSVVIVEVIFGLFTNSLAILSDGLHALLDALTTFVLFYAARASLKPPDEEHMYGHEKFESIGGLIGGIALIGVSILVMLESVLKIIGGGTINKNLEFAGFVAIGYTLCVDFLRVGIFRKAGNTESSTIKAGFYHAISDLSSTILALVGFGLATVGLGIGDSLASIVLSILLVVFSIRLSWNSGIELSDTVPKDVVQKIRAELVGVKGTFTYEKLRVRKSGDKIFVRATLRVPDYMSLEGAHELSAQIESGIRRTLRNVDIAFHIEPAGTKDMPTRRLIERLASEVKGVQEIHEVSIAHDKNRIFVTLHALVDPNMAIGDAHAIAEMIEGKVSKNLENLGNITVHIEPFSAIRRKEYSINKKEIEDIIQRVGDRNGQKIRIKRTITYVADGKKYVNMDCVFSRSISIENAHAMASEAEKEVMEKSAETIVTVHMEPGSIQQ